MGFYTIALPPFFLGLTVGTLVAAAGVLGEVAWPSAQGKAASKKVVVHGGRLAGSSFLFLIAGIVIAGIVNKATS